MTKRMDFTDYTQVLFYAGVITKTQQKDINYSCRTRENQLRQIEEARVARIDRAEALAESQAVDDIHGSPGGD